MTLQEFEQKLRALLREAEDSGLDVDDFCQVAEDTIATGWDDTTPSQV